MHQQTKGSPQWIVIEFKAQAEISQVNIMFQGGFAGKVNFNFILKRKECELQIEGQNNSWQTICPFHPKDDNSLQVCQRK